MSSLGSPNPFFIAGKKAYEVERSLRFNDDDGASLTRTQSTSPTNSKKGTLSFWVKRGNLGNSQHFYNAYADNNNRGIIYFRSDVNALQIGNQSGGSFYSIIRLNRLFRDSSAWYHIVIGFDTTQGTAADRIKVYVNGSQETSFHTSNYPSQNDDIVFFNRANVKIGAAHDNQANEYFDGYTTEFNYIDGTALTPSSFGETNTETGQWIPKRPSVTYGTNGFRLNFSDNSGTTATTLGKDSSGNGNNFTPNNFSVAAGAGNDSVEDTPTNNFPTFNPLCENNDHTYLEGNLKVTHFANNQSGSTTSMATPRTGKWYWEVRALDSFLFIGVTADTYLGTGNVISATNTGGSTVAYYNDGQKYVGGSASGYGASFANGDLIGVAVDMDNGQVTFYKNNASQGAISLISTRGHIGVGAV